MTIPDEHLYHDGIDGAVAEALGERPDVVLFASRHQSAAGRPSLTTHPIGNFGSADYGGRAGTLPPSAPRTMSALLRALRGAARDLSREVTFECTHHGPSLDTPALYIEVGSDAAGWEDRAAAGAVARAILDATPGDAPIALAFGGGHYVPRATDLAVQGRYDFGHMASRHAVEVAGAAVVEQALRQTPGATHAVFHARAAERPALAPLMERARALGLTVIGE